MNWFDKFEKSIKRIECDNFWSDIVFVLSVFFLIILASFIIDMFIVIL